MQWYILLHELKKMDEEKLMEVEHQKLVCRMIRDAEGGTGLFHKITKSAAWRGGVSILEEEQEDAKLLARCEEKRKNGQRIDNVTRRCKT